MFFLLSIRGPLRSTQRRSSAASDLYKRRQENEARYAVARERFDGESRDEPWASTREATLRKSADDSGVAAHLVDVVCRTTLCELTWEDFDTHAFSRVRTSGPMQELGKDLASHLQGAPTERIWVVLGPREGTSLVP